MKYIRITLCCIILFNTFVSAFSQTSFSGWLADFNTFKINTRFSVHFDAQLRSSDQLQNIQTVLLRPGLNWHLNKKMIVTTGYAYIQNKRAIGNITGYTPEHRIWEQFLITHPLIIGASQQARKGSLSHRFRLEQRFIGKPSVENNRLVNSGNVFANRFRYFIRNITPLVPWTGSGKGPFIAIQNEVFVNIGDASSVNGKFFDQNRAYLAMGYRFHTRFDAELGYMNQYINGRDKAFTNNHILQVATYVRL